MQNLHEILVQKKIKEIRFKAIASIVCGFLGIIPYLGFLFALASWILFFILLYDLKIYGGAKNLFKNLFIAAGIGFFGILISTSSLFVILEPRISYSRIYFDGDNTFLAITVFLILYIPTLALIFPFLKAFYYEIARATKQKYFIYAFDTHYLGLLTLIIGIGLVFLLASLFFWILAWVEFKEFDKQEISNKEKFTIPTQKVIFDFDLKWIKITMALSLVLFSVILGLSNFTQIITFQSTWREFFDFETYGRLIHNLFYIRYVLFYIATFLALLSVFLFCKKLKTYKMLIYFFVWQALIVLKWNLRFILKLIMGEDVFIENFILDKIISVAYIIIAFFFFKTLVQATKEKLFYLVFAFFVCGEIVSKLFFAFIRLLDSIRLQETIVDIIYIGIPFTPAYFISFLIVWLSLKGQKEVKKAI
ncbi:hypothetical protein [Campylobacter coli]|uniref:hypothetical protein n=1 Tax=Campylobacter coli TaxID=195 RepID=UPI000ABC5010|nr:hypothetical protein [Campylobacter coli]